MCIYLRRLSHFLSLCFPLSRSLSLPLFCLSLNSFSSDASVLQTWKGRSFTPCVGQLLSLPPHLRQTTLGYLLLGVFPPKVQDYDCLYTKVLEFCTPLCEVVDHATSPPVNRTVGLDINRIIEDSRGDHDCFIFSTNYVKQTHDLHLGLPKPCGCKSAPAKNGACPLCEIKAVRCCKKKKSAYMAATASLGAR
jgi:hypothetical protein